MNYHTYHLKEHNIYLVGFMATGKSRVGKALAGMMQRAFFDTDDFIEKTSGHTIAELFSLHGEKYFRKLECEAVETMSRKREAVISLGGGAVLDPDNWQRLTETGLTICLQADPDVLADRISRKKNRPLLSGYSKSELQSRIQSLLQEREPYYCRAHYIFKSREHIPADELAATIFKTLWTDYASN